MKKKLGAVSLYVALAAGAIFVASPPVAAQQYPVRPLKIIVPFPPGGGNDFIARFIAQRLTPALGQQVIVENKPGAGGAIGIEAGVKSSPDGYTITLISSGYTILPSTYSLKFDPLSDIVPIIQLSKGPLVILVNPSVEAKTTAELISLARAKPGRLNFASSGQGSTIHLATELFASMAGVRMNHVPYKGTGPALTDTIAGQTDLYFSSITAAKPYISSGRLRAIAVTTSERIPLAPDIPTVAESGLPGYEVILWHGLAGPKGMPRAIVDRINNEVSTVLKSKDAAEQLQNDGVSPSGSTPEQLLATIKKEITVWRKVVRDTGVKVE